MVWSWKVRQRDVFWSRWVRRTMGSVRWKPGSRLKLGNLRLVSIQLEGSRYVPSGKSWSRLARRLRINICPAQTLYVLWSPKSRVKQRYCAFAIYRGALETLMDVDEIKLGESRVHIAERVQFLHSGHSYLTGSQRGFEKSENYIMNEESMSKCAFRSPKLFQPGEYFIVLSSYARPFISRRTAVKCCEMPAGALQSLIQSTVYSYVIYSICIAVLWYFILDANFMIRSNEIDMRE